MNDFNPGKVFRNLALAAGLFVLLLAFAVPKWRVWQQGLEGEAALERSKQQKLVMVEQARAEMESAELRAKAIAIIGASAKEFPEYRLQEFIGAFSEAMREGTINQIIYVPTEGSIPILEAGKR